MEYMLFHTFTDFILCVLVLQRFIILMDEVRVLSLVFKAQAKCHR